jgi:hypothetical protein
VPLKGAGTGAGGLGMRKCRIVHGASLILFLIYAIDCRPGRSLSATSIQQQVALLPRTELIGFRK